MHSIQLKGLRFYLMYKTKRAYIYVSEDDKLIAKQYLPESIQSKQTDVSISVQFKEALESFLIMEKHKEIGYSRLVDFDESQQAVIMENIAGTPLSKFKNVTENLLRSIMGEIYKWDCAGLLHSDLSPNNIIITKTGIKFIDLDDIFEFSHGEFIFSNIFDFERKTINKIGDCFRLPLPSYFNGVSHTLHKGIYNKNYDQLATWYGGDADLRCLRASYGLVKSIHFAAIDRENLAAHEELILNEFIDYLSKNEEFFFIEHVKAIFRMPPPTTKIRTTRLLNVMSYFSGCRTLILIMRNIDEKTIHTFLLEEYDSIILIGQRINEKECNDTIHDLGGKIKIKLVRNDIDTYKLDLNNQVIGISINSNIKTLLAAETRLFTVSKVLEFGIISCK